MSTPRYRSAPPGLVGLRDLGLEGDDALEAGRDGDAHFSPLEAGRAHWRPRIVAAAQPPDENTSATKIPVAKNTVTIPASRTVLEPSR